LKLNDYKLKVNCS